MKLGIFGGTFNPVHNGHIHLAEAFRQQLGLDRVLMIPANDPPHKEAPGLVGGEHRSNLCRIAARRDPWMEISDLELHRSGESYTSDTLTELREQYPDGEFYLLTGSDMFLTVDTWHDAPTIFREAVICGAARNPGEEEALRLQEEKLRALGAETCVISIEPLPCSSTQVRDLLEQRESTGDLLDPEVLDYIAQNGLYGLDADQYPWDLDGFDRCIRERLKPSRYHHSCCVAEAAVRLAKRYGASETLAFVAGLLHDVCKNDPAEDQLQRILKSGIIVDNLTLTLPQLYHAISGTVFMYDELNIRNLDILRAVRYHTTGRAGMSLLETVIFLADLTSEDRNYPDVEEMRRRADRSIDEAMTEALRFTVGNLRNNGIPLTPETEEICREYGIPF